MLAQHAAEMLRCDRDQVFRDLPGREGAELSRPPFLEAAPDQILPSAAIVLGDPGKPLGSRGIAQLPKGPVRRDVEIGRKIAAAHATATLMFAFYGSIPENAAHASFFAIFIAFS